jgi:thiamine biosynthesis lipoprotein
VKRLAHAPDAPGSTLRCALLGIAVALLTGCGQGRDLMHKSQLLAMGTLVNVSIWTHDDGLAERAIATVTRELNDANDRWHAWRPSPLTDINKRIAAGRPATVDPLTRDLILKSKDLAAASDNLFNPAIGALIGLWGFHSDDRPDDPPPTPALIDALVAAAPTMAALHLDGDQLTSTNPRVQLDFGGIAKGYAVDLAVDRIRKLGVQNAIVDAGGDLRAIGAHGDRPWRIGIRNPRGPGVIAAVEARGDESIFTSGDYERYFIYQGKRYHHIIDPRTGYPSTGAASATVIYTNAAAADAAATALVVAGPGQWRAVAKAMGLRYVMLIDSAGTVYMTPAMAQRVKFEVDPRPKVIVAQP